MTLIANQFLISEKKGKQRFLVIYMSILQNAVLVKGWLLGKKENSLRQK